MKVSATQGQRPYFDNTGDLGVFQTVLASNTDAAHSAQIVLPENCERGVYVCKRVDADNYALAMTSARLGVIVEVYAEGGEIELFSDHEGVVPFVNGEFSVTVSSGVRLVMVTMNDGPMRWAYINGS